MIIFSKVLLLVMKKIGRKGKFYRYTKEKNWKWDVHYFTLSVKPMVVPILSLLRICML